MCSSATTKTRHVMLDFDMVSEIITFEKKGGFGKEEHQNFGVKVRVARDMVIGDKNYEKVVKREMANNCTTVNI